MTQTTRERGQSGLETIGLVIIAALMILGIAFALGSHDLPGRVRWAVCQIVTLGQGQCGDPNDPGKVEDPRQPTEPCTLAQDGWAGAVKLQVSYATMGKGVVIVKEYMSDGTVRVTMTKSASVGANAGVGVTADLEVNGTHWGGDASAAVSTDLEGAVSRTYTVKGDQQVKDLENWLMYEVAWEVANSKNPLKDLMKPAADEAAKRLGLKPPPEPDSVTYSGGKSSSASADLTQGIKGVSVDLQQAQNLSVTVNKDQTKTVGAQISVSGNVKSSYGLAVNGTNGELSIRREDTVNPDGTMKSTTLRIVTKGPNGFTEYTATLPIKTDADRQLAAEMLVNPAKAQEFIDRVKADGQYTKMEYSTAGSIDATGTLGGEVEAIALGAQASGKKISTRANAASYWDGQGWVNWDKCLSPTR